MKHLLSFALLLALNAQAQLGRKLYCGQGYTANIVVYDAATLDSIGFIAGAGGYRMAYCAPLNKVYSTGAGDFVTVINALTNQIITEINLDTLGVLASEVEAITISPDGSTVYVADEGGNGAIWAISTSTDQVTLTNTLVVDEPENLCIGPDGAFLYLADNSSVHKIDASTLSIVDSEPTGGDGHGVTIASDGSVIYVQSSGGVTAYSTGTLAVMTTYSANGYYLEMDASTGKVLGASESNVADVLDPVSGTVDQVTWSVGSSRGITTSPDGSLYFIATSSGVYAVDAGSLTVLDSNLTHYAQSVLNLPTGPSGVSDDASLSPAFHVAPNPASDRFTVLLKTTNTPIEVFDALGQRIIRTRVATIDVSTWSEGVYLVRVEGRTQRIIIQR